MELVVRPYVYHVYIYSDKHTSMCEEIKKIHHLTYLKEARFAGQLPTKPKRYVLNFSFESSKSPT